MHISDAPQLPLAPEGAPIPPRPRAQLGVRFPPRPQLSPSQQAQSWPAGVQRQPAGVQRPDLHCPRLRRLQAASPPHPPPLLPLFLPPRTILSSAPLLNPTLIVRSARAGEARRASSGFAAAARAQEAAWLCPLPGLLPPPSCPCSPSFLPSSRPAARAPSIYSLPTSLASAPCKSPPPPAPIGRGALI